MVLKKMVEIVAEYKDLNPEEITPDKSFEELGLDSLDTVELVLSLEEEFNITIPTEEPVKTVGELEALIKTLQG